MSNVAAIEQRARALDEARKVRLVKSQEIDTEKYLKAHDVTHKVHDASVWLVFKKFNQCHAIILLGWFKRIIHLKKYCARGLYFEIKLATVAKI